MWRPLARKSTAILLLLLPAAAFGADASVTQQQKAYLSSPEHQKQSVLKLRGISPMVFPGCESVTFGSDSLAVTRELEFDGNGAPRVGAWKEIFHGTACGRTRTLTLFWAADEKGNLDAAYGVPGTTIATLPAQKVAIAQAVQAGAGKYSGCTSGSIDNTRFDMALMLSSTPPEPPITGSWREIWVVSACGHLVDVPLIYAQSAGSLRITAEPASIVDHKEPTK